ncbi:hypothetical protein DASC09_055080 [Saccharomycopsis crataegensis]|uniref:RING-type domain-containing protein n=1 Tax=Saccharomycopsis crataegensis TaxID=43959 RepID=A0AAV5QTY0_9ASCO|nr:hypothetical protein DASC09_055080 [Saccharomycopsis crataegensis]
MSGNNSNSGGVGDDGARDPQRESDDTLPLGFSSLFDSPAEASGRSSSQLALPNASGGLILISRYLRDGIGTRQHSFDIFTDLDRATNSESSVETTNANPLTGVTNNRNPQGGNANANDPVTVSIDMNQSLERARRRRERGRRRRFMDYLNTASTSTNRSRSTDAATSSEAIDSTNSNTDNNNETNNNSDNNNEEEDPTGDNSSSPSSTFGATELAWVDHSIEGSRRRLPGTPVLFTEAIIFSHNCHHDKSLTVKRFKELGTIEFKEELECIDNCCGICYDEFMFNSGCQDSENPNKGKKRAADGDDKESIEDEQRQKKKRKIISTNEEESLNVNTDPSTVNVDSSAIEASETSTAQHVSPQDIFNPALTEPSHEEDNDDNINSGDSVDLSSPEARKELIESLKNSHGATQLPCGHAFGTSCIVEWFQNSNTCPYCREKIEDPYKKNRKKVIIKHIMQSGARNGTFGGASFIRDLLVRFARSQADRTQNGNENEV